MRGLLGTLGVAVVPGTTELAERLLGRDAIVQSHRVTRPAVELYAGRHGGRSNRRRRHLLFRLHGIPYKAGMDEPTTPLDLPALRATVALRGVLPTAALLGTNRESLLRLLAGLPVRRGTLALIHQNLSALAQGEEVTKSA